jgi:formate/nitrite transporter FocA (FNT family)
MFAWVIGNTSVFAGDIRQLFAALGYEVLTVPFWTVLLRAIFAGWLIALMVWLLPFAETVRVTVIILITYVIGLSGFAHIIAGSVATFVDVVVGVASWSTFLGKFFVPTLLGNIVGGVALVAVVSYAQIASEKRLTGARPETSAVQSYPS